MWEGEGVKNIWCIAWIILCVESKYFNSTMRQKLAEILLLLMPSFL